VIFLKIAITERAYDRQGGTSIYVAELVEHFAKEHEVHVYSTKWKDVRNRDIIFHKVHSIQNQYLLEWLSFAVLNTVRFKLKKNEFNIVHTNGYDSLYHDVITAHSIHIAALNYLSASKSIRGLGIVDSASLTIEKLIYCKCRNYKKIIADATSGKRELMKYYNVPEEDIEVIPLGVDLNDFMSDQPDAVLKKTYNISSQDIVLIIVATEFHRKGMVELIEAMRILHTKRHKNIKLLIVGKAKVEGTRRDDSFYRELVKKYDLNNNIIFTGSKSNSNNMELTKHYNLADIFVFPTKYEGFGIPTVEAMACELPVIVGPSGAGEDLIKNGKNGFLLDNVNDPREIADKILILAEDEKLRKTMGKAARKTAHICSWDNIAARTMKVYEEVIRC